MSFFKIDEVSVTAESLMRVVATVWKHNNADLRDLRDYFLRESIREANEPHEREFFSAAARFFAKSIEE